LSSEVFTQVAHDSGLELGLMAASVAVGLAGIFLGRLFYKTSPAIPESLGRALSVPHRVLLDKYYVDELYQALFVRGAALGGGNVLHGVDRYVVDGGGGEVRPGLGVNGVAWGVREVLARLSNLWDRYVVDGLVNLLAFVLDSLSYLFRAVQNGLVQHYAFAMLVGVLLLIASGGWILRLY
jgi:NADH-quinone oxidoreductase subunit L